MVKFLEITFLTFLVIGIIACKKDDDNSMPTPEPEPRVTKFSQYVSVSDGTKLAVTVYLPEGLTTEDKVPTLFVMTRYTREEEVNGTSDFFTNAGYAVVSADARGSSASFGVRPGEYSRKEVADMKDVIDWIVAQDWADGNIGSFGVSYTGTTAELMAATQHPAVKAVIPGWSDFDVYDSPARPYGAFSTGFIATWSEYVSLIDNGLDLVTVDEDTASNSLADMAIAEHSQNLNVFENVRDGKFKDSKLGEDSYIESCPLYWKDEIEASNVPMFVIASWMDAGSADGAIKRFQHFSNPQKVLIMPDNHGSSSHASPYQVAENPIPPSMSPLEVFNLHLDFFDTHLKGLDKGVDSWPAVQYYNFGEEAYLNTEVWPPQGSNQERFYFNDNSELSQSAPTGQTGQDQYAVDFSTSTGAYNRWLGQLGQHIMGLDDRGAMDAKMLTYTTEPLSQDVQISGTPVVSLQLESTHEEGLVLVYLEDVDENGKSTYITEGGLNLIHRKESTNPDFDQTEPYHSFLEMDASLIPVNQQVEVNLQLLPTSVKIKAGHRIRVAIAGADSGAFDRIPQSGDPVFTFYRNAMNTSYIDLPTVQ